MKIENSQLKDVSKIFDLYRIATEYMKSKNQVHWPEFSKDLIINEVEENRQWKLLIDEKIACIWATALNDKLIWGDKDNEPSLYIHRIATNPDFRGQNLVKKLINWANEYGRKNSLKYIRLDTVGLNKGLIGHYEKLGFQFLGTKELEYTKELPAHYNNGEVCYFQKEIILDILAK
ncbi:MAG: GNAT superfamily N-acetyltransferase [Crocinitomix sp.]|jgi:GNAT superfamily N-acetyltransferase